MQNIKRRGWGILLAVGLLTLAATEPSFAQTKKRKAKSAAGQSKRVKAAKSAKGVSTQAQLAAIRAEVASLEAAVVSVPTLAEAVVELEAALTRIQGQQAIDLRAVASIPEANVKMDVLQQKIESLARDLEYLRGALASVEQPSVSSTTGEGSTKHVASGMMLQTADGKYTTTIGGYMHPRYALEMPENFSSLHSAGFRMRRARVGLRGKLGSDRLRYRTLIELTAKGAPMLDYYMDMRYGEALSIRLGQSKVPYTRSFLAGTPRRAFLDLSTTQKLQRYDRDVGVWALGSFFHRKLRYQAGASNGSGLNRVNSNIDLVFAARVEGALLGDYIVAGTGDVEESEEARLTVGAAVVHDLVPMQEVIAGVKVGSLDVDSDGLVDNVRVISSVVDAQFRYRGWDLSVEGTWRHERWGSILSHDDNSDISAAVDASSFGRRNYLGVTGKASYFVVPHKLLLGMRVSHGRLPVLGLGGRNPAAPPLAQRALQVDALVQLYRDGFRRVGFMYSLTNFNAKTGADPAGDISHSFMVEAQLIL